MLSEYRTTAQTTWDTIADSFDTTRQRPWRYCLRYIDSLPPNALVADLGCGNGRHLFPCAERCAHVIGVDLSQRFLQIISKKLSQKSLTNVSLVHADVVQLPFVDNSFDALLFLASLHNIQGKDHRQRALTEVARILKPQGTAVISVWSRWQERFYRHFLKQLLLRNREFGDIDISWRQHNKNIPRFYHLYSKSEFLQELQDAALTIERFDAVRIHSKRGADNYFAVVKKR
ncbi:MAG: class I SAM-dependent methyltransferase [Candidatus Thermoplasmatota archaeon]